MKDSVTRFNFDDAFKALDEIEIPVAEKGIRANRVDLKESMKRVDKFELLFEDFYDVNNADDMNAVSEEREAEVAKAKLARIEKIVDLDAETEDDILPSYVGKTIIQCPQCMTLFYKNAEDIVRDEENPDVVNVNEVCQHCGNESGYDVVGKVAEETEAAPGDELGTDEFSAEVGDGENDIAIDDGNETTEEAPVEEEGGEVDELSAEADLDSLDLDAELDFEEEPIEEEEEVEESLNTSELLKKIEDKNELKTEHESEKLTLNEDIEDNLDDKLKAHEEYIKELRDTISELEKKLASTKNEQIKTSIQSRIDAARTELEAALPEAVKAEAETEELPDATEAGMEDATDNTSEETEAAKDETEETTESLHEAVESMTDTLNRAWEVAKKTNSPIGVTVVTPVGAGTLAKIKDWSHNVNANLYYVDAKNPDLMVTGFDEKMISRPDTIIVIDEFNRAHADAQKAIGDEIDNLDTQVEMVIVISNDSNTNGDNFKRFKQYVAVVEKETATESLTEAVKIVDNEKYWVDYRPAFEAVAKEVDGKFDFALNFNVYNEKIVVETKAAIQKEDLSKLLDAMTNSKVCKENNWKAVYTGLEDNKENMIKIQFEAAKSQTAKNEGLTEDVSMTSSPENFKTLLGTKEFKKPISQEEVESYFENFTQASEEKEDEELSDEADIEISVEGDTDPVKIDTESSTLTEAPWGAARAAKKAAKEADEYIDKIITMMVANKFKYLYILPFINSNTVARYLSTQPGLFDAGASYTQTNKRFLATTNNSQDFPLFIAQIDPSEDKEQIKTKISTKLSKIAEQLKNISKTKAYEFADVIGGTKINPVGKHYELADSKAMPFDNVDLVGVKNPIPDISEGMSAGEAKVFTERVPKSLTWLMRVNSTGSLLVNNEALNATDNSTADPIEDPSYKSALEKRISQFANVASINTTDDGATFTVVDVQAKDKYLALRNVCIENSDTTGTPFYIIGLVDELKGLSKGKSEAITIDIIKNLAIEQFIDGQPKKVSSFTGKLPEKTEEEKETKDTDPDTDEESKEVSSDVSSGEPSTPEARKPYLEKIIEKSGKKFIGIKLNKNGKSFIPIGKDKVSLLSKAETFEKLLEKLPAVKILGIPVDTAILLVDATATYEVGKEITGKTLGDTDFLAKCPAGGKVTTNLKAVADSLGITMEAESGPAEEDDDFDITDESFKVTDIDESSFNESLTESLKEVYENVNSFTMTDCSLADNKLVVEGLITFKSGKVKTTSYIFEAHKAVKNTLIGINKDLFESGELKLDTKILNETLYAGSLSYKYSVGEKIVEGLIKNK